MNELEILKITKNSYEDMNKLLKNANISKEESNKLEKSMNALKNIYNSTYSKIFNHNELITNECCKNCNNNLLVSDNIDYSYQCVECDENYYDFEVDTNNVWYKKGKEENKKINSSFCLELDYDNKDKTIFIGTETGAGAKCKCNTIGELIDSIKFYCYNYLDYGKRYSIEIWETDWHRNVGEGYIYNNDFDNYDEALRTARKLFEDYNYASIEILDNKGEAIYCRDNESEDFYFENERISCVDNELLSKYIDNWTNYKEQDLKVDKLYCRGDDSYIGIDNSTGNCWIEEFQTEKEVQEWLLGKTLEKEDLDNEI